MARERPRRQSTTAHDRVGIRPASRPRPARGSDASPAGPIRRFTGALFGITRTITVDGVRYRERNRVTLDRALGPRGKGGKVYEVRFPTGRPMTINATETRRYADLMTVPSLAAISRARRFVRPGERALVLGSGTGAIAELVARWTGPHGGVVALEHDHESVRFARRRYAPPSTSLERGGTELLAGEMAGAFEVIIADQSYLFACEQPARAWEEIWRVLSPAGRVIHVGGSSDHPASAPRVPAGLSVQSVELETGPGVLPVLVLSRGEGGPSRAETEP